MATEHFYTIVGFGKCIFTLNYIQCSHYKKAQILNLHMHASVSRQDIWPACRWCNKREMSIFVWLDDIFCSVCTSGHRCLHDYPFTCAPAVKFSQEISGLIEPQRDCVMDGRWGTHWPVTSTPPKNPPTCFHSHSLLSLTPACAVAAPWVASVSSPALLFHIHTYSLSLTLPSPLSASLDFSRTATSGPLNLIKSLGHHPQTFKPNITTTASWFVCFHFYKRA